jgi:hypothetical protein
VLDEEENENNKKEEIERNIFDISKDNTVKNDNKISLFEEIEKSDTVSDSSSDSDTFIISSETEIKTECSDEDCSQMHKYHSYAFVVEIPNKIFLSKINENSTESVNVNFACIRIPGFNFSYQNSNCESNISSFSLCSSSKDVIPSTTSLLFSSFLNDHNFVLCTDYSNSYLIHFLILNKILSELNSPLHYFILPSVFSNTLKNSEILDKFHFSLEHFIFTPLFFSNNISSLFILALTFSIIDEDNLSYFSLSLTSSPAFLLEVYSVPHIIQNDSNPHVSSENSKNENSKKGKTFFPHQTIDFSNIFYYYFSNLCQKPISDCVFCFSPKNFIIKFLSFCPHSSNSSAFIDGKNQSACHISSVFSSDIYDSLFKLISEILNNIPKNFNADSIPSIWTTDQGWNSFVPPSLSSSPFSKIFFNSTSSVFNDSFFSSISAYYGFFMLAFLYFGDNSAEKNEYIMNTQQIENYNDENNNLSNCSLDIFLFLFCHFSHSQSSFVSSTTPSSFDILLPVNFASFSYPLPFNFFPLDNNNKNYSLNMNILHNKLLIQLTAINPNKIVNITWNYSQKNSNLEINLS